MPDLLAAAIDLILAALADGDQDTAAALEDRLSDPDALAELLGTDRAEPPAA